MLVVGRRKGQRIVIGSDIEVFVTEINRSSVKIGIVAPRPYLVLRGEVRDAIEESNRAALSCAKTQGDEGASACLVANPPEARCVGLEALVGTPVKPVAQESVNSATAK